MTGLRYSAPWNRSYYEKQTGARKGQLSLNRVRHESDAAGPLDSPGQLSLVLGTVTGYPGGYYLSPLCNQGTKLLQVFIIDLYRFFCAEPADFPALKPSSLFIPFHLAPSLYNI